MVLQHQIRLVIFLNTNFYWTTYLIEHSFSDELLHTFLYILKGKSIPLILREGFFFLIPQMNQIMSFVFAWYLFCFILVQIEVNFTF